MAARSVRWRGGASRAPVLSRSSEACWLPLLAADLRGALPDVEVTISGVCTDPWTFLVTPARPGTPT